VTEPLDDAASQATAARIDPASIKPLDVDGVAAIGIGTALWLVALIASLLLRDRLAASGDSWWIGVCLAGFLLGIPGLVFLRWRRARHAADS
jgi:hypothetical protein